MGGNIHSSLFLQIFKFSFPPKLGGTRGNEIRFKFRMGVHKGMEWSNHKGMKKNKIEWNVFK